MAPIKKQNYLLTWGWRSLGRTCRPIKQNRIYMYLDC